MQTKLFATTLLLIVSQGTASLCAQDKGGTMTITGASTKVTAKLKDATSVMNVTLKNVASKQHDILTVTKEMDASSPQLLKAVNTKEVLPLVVFKVFKPGDPSKYKTITLTNATITSINRPKPQETKSHDTNELEEVSFTFTAIKIENPVNSTSTSDDWTANSN
jgi:type VI secretion system Hcp family effector